MAWYHRHKGLAGAAAGFAAGSIVPGLGNVVGAIVGAFVGPAVIGDAPPSDKKDPSEGEGTSEPGEASPG